MPSVRVDPILVHVTPSLERKEIAGQSLAANGLIALVPDIRTAVELANAYAPEHLCLLLHDPWAVVPQIRNAGGIFVGEDSPDFARPNGLIYVFSASLLAGRKLSSWSHELAALGSVHRCLYQNTGSLRSQS